MGSKWKKKIGGTSLTVVGSAHIHIHFMLGKLLAALPNGPAIRYIDITSSFLVNISAAVFDVNDSLCRVWVNRNRNNLQRLSIY